MPGGPRFSRPYFLVEADLLALLLEEDLFLTIINLTNEKNCAKKEILTKKFKKMLINKFLLFFKITATISQDQHLLQLSKIANLYLFLSPLSLREAYDMASSLSLSPGSSWSLGLLCRLELLALVLLLGDALEDLVDRESSD